MAKRNEKTVAKSPAPQRLGTLPTSKTEIDFESLIAAGIATVVIKPAKKRRRSWPNPSS
jgi:hypothetical protein